MNLLPCWKCGAIEGPKGVRVDADLSGYGYIVTCDACFDEGSFMAHGRSREEAIQEWNEEAREEGCHWCHLEIRRGEACVVAPVDGVDMLFHDGDIPCWEKWQDRTQPLDTKVSVNVVVDIKSEENPAMSDKDKVSVCPECGREVRLRPDGTVRTHMDRPGSLVACRGVGEQPAYRVVDIKGEEKP